MKHFWEKLLQNLKQQGRGSLTPGETAPKPDNSTSTVSQVTMPAACPPCYVVLDIETTGLSPQEDHIIEFGAIKVKNGQEIDCFTTFINPGCPIPRRITQITGITDADVAHAPDLAAAVTAISAFIGTLPVVAHNASFDLQFLCHAYQEVQMKPQFRYIDTLVLAKYAFPYAPNHKLSTLIDYLGIDGVQVHRALSDVRFTNQLFLACAEFMELTDFPLPFEAPKAERLKQYRSRNQCSIRDITPQQPVTDQNHPFYQKSIVFTGTMKLSRQQAAQMAVDKGAVIRGSVSKRTNYLVVGTQDLSLVGDDGMSSKEKKAMALNDSGEACIHILSETEFLRLLRTDLEV